MQQLHDGELRNSRSAGIGLLQFAWRLGYPGPDPVARSLRTITRLFPEVEGSVDFSYVRRWSPALPHTRRGAYRAIGEFAATIDPESRIQFAGDYLSQTGQNTAVAWGNRAAENLTAHTLQRLRVTTGPAAL